MLGRIVRCIASVALVLCVTAQVPQGFANNVDSPKWVLTGTLTEERAGHTATLLPDGKVLVTGGSKDFGYSPTDGPTSLILDSAELYDPATGTWAATGRLVTARVFHTATLLRNGKVLVVGGSLSTRSAELYDPETSRWSPTGSLIAARNKATANLLPDGRTLVVGGIDSGGNSLRSAELYDPASGAWSLAASPFYARGSHTSTVLDDGRVLVVGGIVAPYDSEFQFPPESFAELYDPVADTWRFVFAPMSVWDHTATLMANGMVLVTGGYSVKSCGVGDSCRHITSRSTMIFSPASGTWHDVSSSTNAHEFPTTTLLQTGEVLVVGDVFHSFDSPYPVLRPGTAAETFDAGTGTWTVAASPNVPRFSHTATMLRDGTVLIVGGDDGNSGITLASAELYGSPPTIDAGFTGSWFNPAQNGHGFALEVIPGSPPQLFASWFTFAPQGGQSWVVGLGLIAGNRAVVRGSQTLGAGGKFPPNFDVANVRQEDWGTLTFTFSDCNHGHVEWTSTVPGYGSGGMDLTRLTLPVGLTCQ